MLTLSLITDLHFGPEAGFAGKLRKLTRSAPGLTKAFVARMNDVVHPDLVVNLGDDIEDEDHDADLARYTACVNLLRGTQAELVNVAGNHDTAHLAPAELLSVWQRPDLDRLYHSFDRGGFHFIVLHTRERKDRDVTVGEDQLRWLREDLASTSAPTVVLMHHSAADQDLRGNRWFEGAPHICLVEERRALRAILRESGLVRAVFNGHLHWNHLDVIDGIPFITLQSLIENLDEDAPGRPAAAHAIVHLESTRVVVKIEGAERATYQFEAAT
ncbi:metallophosphoesterase [Polyangium sp. 6x1]|uniref:metallophosphoesterase family protein n=1 Tax=Polyangium sp. 6x1 TaxID=3042689 RepID=UPI002482F310|nr:metallophosphoesterase [Polyangium sp. 6x1]MDI1444727.1 metallophosphoesterase [Polyangium sp. 6x1]